MPVSFRRLEAVRFAALLGLASAALACNSTEGDCQNVCEWESRCSTDAIGVNDCSQQCVRAMQDRSSACQSAFSDFAGCTGENQSCPGVDNQCVAQANRYIEHCSCEGATGALAALCNH